MGAGGGAVSGAAGATGGDPPTTAPPATTAANASHPAVERNQRSSRTSGLRRLWLGDVLEGHHARAGLLLGGDDANLEPSRRAVHLQGARWRAAASVRDGDIGSQTVGESTAGTVIGQMETDRGSLHRLPGLIGDFHRQRTRIARAGRVHCPFPFNHLDVQNGHLTDSQMRECPK